MKVWLVLAVSVWVMFAAAPACAVLTLDLEDDTPTSYSAFLTSLRNMAKDPKLVYQGIPMMPKPVTPPKVLLVVLKLDSTRSITLAFDQDNLYLVAYCDKDSADKFRAHFFPDAPTKLQTSLFPEAVGKTQRLTISYKSNYIDIEKKAGTRASVGLGIEKLKFLMLAVYGKVTNVKDEAKFLLVAIQMVAEATRFTYIEGQVTANFFQTSFTPNPKVLNLEKNWGKISKAVQTADAKGNFKAALSLEDENGKDLPVDKVSDVKPLVSILAYEA